MASALVPRSALLIDSSVPETVRSVSPRSIAVLPRLRDAQGVGAGSSAAALLCRRKVTAAGWPREGGL